MLSRKLFINFIPSRRLMSKYLINKAYINGQYVDSYSGKTFEVLNPSTGSVLGVVPDMGAAETETAIQHARTAFESFKGTLAKDRAVMLERMRNNFVANADEYAKVITMEMGKPLAEAKGEILYTAGYMDWYAGEARRIYGDVAQAGVHNRRLIFIKQPVGVVGCITPWNFPSAMLARKAGAAIAVGCTMVAKPAEDTPFSALIFAKVAEESGVPPGVLNVVTCRRENAADIGQVLCTSPLVSKISFTGSTAVGKTLKKLSSDTMKRFSGELGGNAPFIVFNSAKIDKAVSGLMAAKFRCSGQTCVCANRIFVQEGIYDEFIAQLTEAIKQQLTMGDGFSENVTQGPLINQKAVDKVHGLVLDATAKGAKAVLGGKMNSELGGLFYEPTLLTDIKPGMKIYTEEIFGPIVSVIKFRTEDEVIKKANDTTAGLGAYFYSQDYSQVWRVGEKLEYGMIGINEGVTSSVEIPFGGIKDSGMGREGSKYGVDDYLNIKLMCFGDINSESS